jgi:hypothetical protein
MIALMIAWHLQPLYATSLPLIFNATVLNGMGVTGRFAGPPVYKAQNEGGSHLHIQFEHSEVCALGCVVIVVTCHSQ